MGYLKNRALHELQRFRAQRRFRDSEFSVDIPLGEVRKILIRNGLGFDQDGNPSWWYASLDCRRNEADDLTKAALKYVAENVPGNTRILGTGCGTGWMLFWLAQKGFSNIEGFDYLPNVVQSAKEIAAAANIRAKLWQDDGFNPKLEGKYGLVLVLHWLYSAWMGNYGNAPRETQDREALLTEFLAQYAEHVENGGLVMIELIDAISDLREPPIPTYPIRHTQEQVARCSRSFGMTVERMMFNSNYGHLPRMLYVLRKS